VTHGVSFLPKVDLIVVLVDGQISEIGTFKELLGHDGAFAEFLKNYLNEDLDDDKKQNLDDLEGVFTFYHISVIASDLINYMYNVLGLVNRKSA